MAWPSLLSGHQVLSCKAASRASLSHERQPDFFSFLGCLLRRFHGGEKALPMNRRAFFIEGALLEIQWLLAKGT
jgi:hypothetical protein